MNTHLKRHLVICECGTPEHQVIFQYFDDEKPEWQELYMDVHLVNHGNIFKNLWSAIRWAFGHKSIYGQFDEFIISPDEAKSMITFMEEFIALSKRKE
jgi:hypothetical protein